MKTGEKLTGALHLEFIKDAKGVITVRPRYDTVELPIRLQEKVKRLVNLLRVAL